MTYPFKNLDPDSVPVDDIFNSFYEVPPNQREFSWNVSDHLQRFWEDLIGCVNEDLRSSQPKKLGHFLGSIVTIGDKTPTFDRPERIIDGQQRITTISLLARVLLEVIDEEHPDDNKRTTYVGALKNWICKDVLGEIQPRLRLNRANDFYHKVVIDLSSMEDREVYWQSLQTLETPAVRIRIVEAMRFFSEKIAEELNAAGLRATTHRVNALENLYYAITQLFYILKLRVTDTRMAYRLFETLNERGMDLSQADLVRNVVLEYAEKLGTADFKKALASWEILLDQVDSQDPDLLSVPELIQFSYSSRYKSVKAEKLFDNLSNELSRSLISPSLFANELEFDSIQWSSFLQGNLGYWPAQALDSHGFIIHIRPLWKKHVVPLLLRVAERFDKKSKRIELGKALWAIECYLFREGTINKSSLSKLEDVLGNSARMVGNIALPDNTFVNELKMNSPDAGFIDNFSFFRAKGKLAFYIAWRIENHTSGTGGYDMSKMSPVKQSPYQHLEHIMPRNPDPSWTGIEKNEGFADFLDRLGNHLVLEGKLNSSIKNGAYKLKLNNPTKKDFSNSSLILPKEVISQSATWAPNDVWDFNSIEKRQKHLATNLAPKVWEISW